MTSLRDVQQAFASAVRFGDASAIAGLVVANGIEPAARVGIHANNVRENLLATLEAAFPIVCQLAGRDWFRQAATAYLRVHPSRSGNLHFAGDRWPAWLEAELADTPWAYFADVARLEWAYQEVLVAAESGGLDLAALATVPAERHGDVVFELAPALRLVGSRYPLLPLWRAHQPGAAADDVIDLSSGPGRLLVQRRDTHVELRELTAGEFAWLGCLARGEPLGSALDAALRAQPDFDLPATLLVMTRRGVLAGFHLGAA